MTKIPLLCCSHTVKGTATISVLADAPTGAFTVTVPEGRYWTDPFVGALGGEGGSPAVATTDLIARIAYLMDAATTGAASVFASTYGGGLTYSYFYRSSIEDTASQVIWQFRGGNASTTTAGKKILGRIGFNKYADEPAARAADNISIDCVGGVWTPNRGESGDVDEPSDAFGGTNRSAGGVAYPFSYGDELPRRTIRLQSLPGVLARWRDPGASEDDFSFENLIKPYLLLGERLRYYADRSATATYLTAALSATAVSASVKHTTVATNDWICIGGEWCKVTAGGGTTTLTLRRPRAVAHAIYTPVSLDFVADYALDADGGGISMRSFTPERTSNAADYWDIDIPLVRTS
jgi:hypothetical protein